MEPPAQPTEETMARCWALPGCLLPVPHQLWVWGEARHPLHSSQCPQVSRGLRPGLHLAREVREG